MRLLALLLVPACGFAPTLSGDAHLGGGEMMMGGEMMGSEPAPPGCYGNGLGIAVCLAMPPTGPLEITGTRAVNTQMFSSDCATLVGPTRNDYCVLVGTSVTINGFLVAEGSRPLIVLSLSTFDVTGTIDVASHHNGSPQLIGPAADPSVCFGTQASASTSGGFGGSFGTKGGDGGNAAPPDGKAGGTFIATSLHGGCGGGYGLDATVNGVGGHGGGAVALIAETSLSVLGAINASGSAGGGAGPSNNGGGGGGSGGLIVLDSPLMTFDVIATTIYANGAGGGGGSSNSGGSSGSNGGDPAGYMAGGGGGGGEPGGSSSGGLGGDGASINGSALNGAEGGNGGGNGGGGGGMGRILIFRAAAPSGGHFSPLPV